MELKQIKELMAVMEKAGIKKLRIKDKENYELELEREGEAHHQSIVYAHPDVPHRFPAQSTPPHRGHHEEEPPAKAEAPGRFVTSPMVGTLYSAPSPDDPVFVKVGDKVDENTVVCIIEAMKVMNEVKAGVSGTVAEILIQNAHPVEFGSKIIRVV